MGLPQGRVEAGVAGMSAAPERTTGNRVSLLMVMGRWLSMDTITSWGIPWQDLRRALLWPLEHGVGWLGLQLPPHRHTSLSQPGQSMTQLHRLCPLEPGYIFS